MLLILIASVCLQAPPDIDDGHDYDTGIEYAEREYEMAAGDILSCTIRADGWSADVVIAGFVDGGAYNWGTLDDDPPTTTTPKFTLTVVSEGYNSAGTLGTVTRTIYGTEAVRIAGTSGLDEVEGGGNLTIRVALSEFVYNDDKNGGAGTSGTDPTVTIGAGWYTDNGTGGSSAPSNAATALTCTNSSTLDYPVAFGQWDHIAGVCTADRVQADFAVAFNARHRSGIACVRFDATGGTSLVNVNTTVSSQTATQRSATTLYGVAHVGTIALASFTQAELITLRARAYPVVGDADAICDTNGRTTAGNECQGWNDAVVVCDKSAALDSIKWVATTGNDTTGDGSEGNPYLTIGKAVQSGTNIVYLKAGTHAAVGVAPASRQTSNEWKIVRPAPGESSATVTVQIDTVKTPRCQRIMYQGVTVTLASTSSWLDGEDADNFIRFKSCAFDSSGVGTPSVPFGYRWDCTYVENCTGDLSYNGWRFGAPYSTSRVAWRIDGCTISESGSPAPCYAQYRLVACAIVGPYTFHQRAAGHGFPPQDGILIEHNSWLDFDSAANKAISIGEVAEAIVGVSFIGNVIEKTAGTSQAVYLGGDTQLAALNHVIAWHNTIAGERCNWGYNDTGSTPQDRLNWSVKFNAMRDFNTKHDLFGTPNAARIGGWPVSYGVGFEGNRSEISLFPGDYIGIDGDLAGDDGIAYVSNKSYTGDGLGNGDYTPDTGCVLLTRVGSGQRVWQYDLYGRVILNNGNGAGGGIQPLSAPVLSTVTGSNIGATSFDSGGTFTWGGGSAITAKGVCWNTMGGPTTADNTDTQGVGDGSATDWTQTVSSVTSGATIYYRSYATNTTGTGYGNVLSLATAASTLGYTKRFYRRRDERKRRT